ncbi:proteasome accessory factor PafA2 family protein [Boudabousia marimammalium]|uniref:Pup--protein ligase n=1 Tax=Boudabousia marimammalium TaxID=156892 RepID=A0A1Q5PQZ0_9ACTO|nr:proteasome accessory factor PafA2 family protein [Boudabousia marimammalium]OKL50041.1 hypothetical protein BM477_03910 [Boudabousia marimammalium]
MKQRIYGLETEYGVARLSSDPNWSVSAAVRQLFSGINYDSQASTFLGNGGRLYVDVGDHPEYATAECDSLRDLLVQDRAGDLMLSRRVRAFNEKHEDSGQSLRIFRNNLDAHGNSFGCHENYLVSREETAHLSDSFFSFLITRTLLTGAGAIMLPHQAARITRPRYVVSPRSQLLDAMLSSRSTSERPLINTRDQPLANPLQYRRVHVMAGDTNVSETATAMKIASTLLVLAALETGINWDDLSLANPLAALRTVGLDLEGGAELELADGRRMSAAQIQSEIIRRLGGVDAFGNLTADPTVTVAGKQWQEMTEAARTQDFSALARSVDWVAKGQLLDQYRSREGLAWTHPRLRELDWAYHDVSGSLRERLEKLGHLPRLTRDEDVESAVNFPPATTRAHARGTLIAAARRCHRDYRADWTGITVGSKGEVKADLPDPFEPLQSETATLVHRIESLG